MLALVCRLRVTPASCHGRVSDAQFDSCRLFGAVFGTVFSCGRGQWITIINADAEVANVCLDLLTAELFVVR